MLSAARLPRMLGLLALLVVAAVVCVRLGAWQIDRAYATSQAAAEAQAEAEGRRAELLAAKLRELGVEPD